MYGELFSKIYDEFGWNYYPEAFAGTLMKWIELHDPSIKAILDLGCGTGILCRILRKNGYRADGVDLSEAMIAIAKAHDPEGTYSVADMTSYCPDRQYDLVTCTGDAINHLIRAEQIRDAFICVYNCLREDGFFIFDLLNENEVSGDETFDYDFSDEVKAQFSMKKNPDRTVQLTVSARENGFQTLCEVITERLYPVEDIRELLRQAGFSSADVSHSLLENGNRAVTWYVTARKTRGDRFPR